MGGDPGSLPRSLWARAEVYKAAASGEITVDEFVSGCMQLEGQKRSTDRCLSRVAVWPGPAKSLHLARLRSEVLTMKKDIQPNTQRSSSAVVVGC